MINITLSTQKKINAYNTITFNTSYKISHKRNQIISSIINTASDCNDLEGLIALFKLQTDSTQFFTDLDILINKKKEDGSKLYPIIEKLCKETNPYWDKIFKSVDIVKERYFVIIKQLQSGKDIYEKNYFSDNNKLKLSLCEKIYNYILEKASHSQEDISNSTLKKIEQLQAFLQNMEYNPEKNNFHYKDLNNTDFCIIKNYIHKKPYFICLLFKNIDNPEIQNNKFHDKSILTIKSEFLKSIGLDSSIPIWHNGTINSLITLTIKEKSAKKIQAHFKGYIIRHTNKYILKSKLVVDIATKSRIHNHMKLLNQHITYVPTAEVVNQNLQLDEIKAMISNKQFAQQENIEDKFKNCISQSIANCMQLAIFLYILIENDPNLKFLNEHLHIIRLKKPDDHVFLLIGSPNDENSLVVDPWVKYLNTKDAHKRIVGFLGTKKQYLNFLKNNANGRYIRSNTLHEFTVADNIIVQPSKRKNIYEFMIKSWELTQNPI